MIRENLLRVKDLEGDIAEVGVSVGDSAEEMCEVKGKKKLHLFDTFEGHPNTIGRYDVGQYPGRHKADIKDVKKRLKKYPKVYFYKGTFPETSKPVAKKKFCFVNLDTDLYRGTYDGLEFFVPRMVPGGVIILHDYQGIPGVACACIDYFEEKHKGRAMEVLLEDNQAVLNL